jgi:hypothetical protein
MALPKPRSFRLSILSTLAFLAFTTYISSQPQTSSTQSQDIHEMLLTEEGFLAIDTPKGWVRQDGPGLAFFVHKGDNSKSAFVWIYISSARIGPKDDAKNLAEYIESDIASFKKQFKKGIVRREEPINLPQMRSQAPVYTFLSGETFNAFEQIVYIAEINRVLILALSAKEKDAFEKSLMDFRQFAESYRGSITPTETPAK